MEYLSIYQLESNLDSSVDLTANCFINLYNE